MKEKIQVFGRFLSGMIMPVIGAFIAWGFITALFIPKGWIPNETFAQLVDPMSKYLLTLLIAYTGGTITGGQRGGVIGAIAAMGVIVGSDVPMFLGAMLMGPLSGAVIKKFDAVVEGKIKAGFEMIVNNFSVGILGGILAIIGMIFITPLVNGLNQIMSAGVGFFVDRGLLPLTSILIEPAKVLFLNNALNHGILSPMGINQAAETGKSIFFLLESNPGPGLGILLAYCIAGTKSAKSTAPGAVIIHFLGGIHEIYFPYILMNPILILAGIAGGAAGTLTFSLFGGGLVAPASPGSMIAILAMTPRDGYAPVIAGVLAAFAISFFISMVLLKLFGSNRDLEAAAKEVQNRKAESKGVIFDTADTITIQSLPEINKIVFACDAGMGSSAMGATVLKKKLKEAGLTHIEVVHASVSSIPKGAQIVVTHNNLKERAAHSAPEAKLILITNFMAAPEYDQLVQDLKSEC